MTPPPDQWSELERQPRYLFVPGCHFIQGERWVRESYMVGDDVIIRESQPLPAPPEIEEKG